MQIQNKVPQQIAMATVFEKHSGYEQLYEILARVEEEKAIKEEVGSVSKSNERDLV